MRPFKSVCASKGDREQEAISETVTKNNLYFIMMLVLGVKGKTKGKLKVPFLFADTFNFPLIIDLPSEVVEANHVVLYA